jgi:DNA-nicking Smr family endonuclease
MFSITKDDKKVWTEYVSSLNSYTLKFNTINSVKSKKSLHKISLKETKSFSKLLKKGLLKLDNVIDFHGYRLNDARIVLKNFIIMSYKSNYKNILVITGKGQNNSGALKKELPNWLCEKEISKYIISHMHAPQNLGGEGAFLIRVKSKNKSLT